MKNFKHIFSFLFLLIIDLIYACDACKLAQPKITRNFTHGVGPSGNVDWIIVGVVSLIILYTLIFSIKYLAKPGEKKANHIKYSILQDQKF